MRLGRSVLIVMFLLLPATVLPAPAYDGEIAEASRRPGGINPADIDWRCSIMAGRIDRAYLNCAAFVQQEERNPAVKFLIENPPPARGPLRIYGEDEARARGLYPRR